MPGAVTTRRAIVYAAPRQGGALGDRPFDATVSAFIGCRENASGMLLSVSAFQEVVMELHMHSHHWEHRLPNWPAAAVAGFAAGAVLMVLELFWSTMVTDVSPWTTSRMVASIVLGPDTMQTSDFSVGVVAVAMATHYVLGIVLGLILAAIIAPFHFDSSIGMVLLTGAVFGLVVYLFNFYGMARFFSWFDDMRGWSTLVAHLIFGMSAAIIYWKLERPIKE